MLQIERSVTKREFILMGEKKKSRSCISTSFSRMYLTEKKSDGANKNKMGWVEEGRVRSKLRSPPPTY